MSASHRWATVIVALGLAGGCTDDATPGASVGGDGGTVSDGRDAASRVDAPADDGLTGGATSDSSPTETGDSAGTALSGWAQLTGPVAGAVVEVWSLDEELAPVSVVATGSTGENGAFSLDLAPGVKGWVEVRLTGTKARYAVGGEAESLDPDDRLATLASVTLGADTAHVAVHGWTTMAVTLARAYASKGDGGAAAIQLAYRRLEDHLWRPEDAAMGAQLVTLPGEAAYDPDRPDSRLGLTHLGFAGLAARWSATSGDSVKVIDVVTALSRDLDNALFDGLRHAADGSLLPVAVGESKPLGVDTTRRDLARAIHEMTQGVDQAPLLAAGGIYEDLSLDDGLLYPPAPSPSAFDPEAPDLAWEPPTPAEGTIVAHDFTARVTATDPSGVTELVAALVAGDVETPLVLAEMGGMGTARTAEVAVTVEGLDQGQHAVRVTARDPDANTATIERAFHVDTVAPFVSFGPLLPATTSPTITLGGAAKDPEPQVGLSAGVAAVVLSVGGVETDAVANGATWSATVAFPGPGSHEIRVTAEDGVGNAATVAQITLFDPNPPQLTITSPEEGQWVKAPAGVAGTAPDAGVGGVAVTVTVNFTTLDATFGEDGAWSVQLPALPDGSYSALAKATDALGNQAVAVRTLLLDNTPPVIGVAPGLDGSFTASDSVVVSGTITDAGSGPASVAMTADGQPVVTTLVAGVPTTFSATVPVSTAGTLVSITGHDNADNSSAPLTLTITRDLTPPVVAVTAPAGPEVWTNTAVLIEGTAEDAGAGVAAVHLAVDGGPPSAAAMSVDPATGVVTWSKSFAPLPGGTLAEGPHTIEVWAVDAVGNAAEPVGVGVVVDVTPPVLGLGADKGYVPENLCTVEFGGSKPSYKCPMEAAKENILSALCKPNCGSIRKYPQRLGYTLGSPTFAEMEAQNLPHFSLSADDASATWVGGTGPALTYRFRYPAAQGQPDYTAWLPVTAASLVPVATQSWGAGATIPTSTTKLPTGIEFRAMDKAGNTTTSPLYSFEIELLTPPPQVEPMSLPGTPLLETGKALSFAGLTLHEPFMTPATGIRVARLLVKNPYPMPLGVTVKVPNPAAGALLATASGDRRYGEATPLSFDGLCTPDASVFDFQCQAGESCPAGCSAKGPTGTAWTRSAAATSYTLRTLDPDTGLQASLASPLVPGQSVWVDLYASFTGTCVVMAPKNVPGYATPANHVYLRSMGTNCAGASPVTGGDTVTSWYHDKCGYDCPLSGAPPCSACKDHQFLRPAASLVQAVELATGDKKPLLVPIQAAADGAKPYGQLDAPKAASLVLKHKVDTTTGVDAPYPSW